MFRSQDLIFQNFKNCILIQKTCHILSKTEISSLGVLCTSLKITGEIIILEVFYNSDGSCQLLFYYCAPNKNWYFGILSWYRTSHRSTKGTKYKEEEDKFWFKKKRKKSKRNSGSWLGFRRGELVVEDTPHERTWSLRPTVTYRHTNLAHKLHH